MKMLAREMDNDRGGCVADFTLLKQFEDKLRICDLKLSRVLLNDTKLPWIFLIPRRPNIRQMNELSESDQMHLMREINAASNVMERLFPCIRLNVAAIGNKTPQLHIHLICRTEDDGCWPETVWQYSCEKMNGGEYEFRCGELRKAFGKNLSI
ncbi:MAG: HIT domain-containing protein [Puniceicoccales bacterium]|jgi:diadenosine tetraphosphate (Ap4A) HIT family hydrolase|nr:HIT domain-containing protein [Puniceicoccales bacterium]